MKELTAKDLEVLERRDLLYIRGLLKLRLYSLNSIEFKKGEKARIQKIDDKLENILHQRSITNE